MSATAVTLQLSSMRPDRVLCGLCVWLVRFTHVASHGYPAIEGRPRLSRNSSYRALPNLEPMGYVGGKSKTLFCKAAGRSAWMESPWRVVGDDLVVVVMVILGEICYGWCKGGRSWELPPPPQTAPPRDLLRVVHTMLVEHTQERKLGKVMRALETVEQPQIPQSRTRASGECPKVIHQCLTQRCRQQ
ncbi:hypothetical protein Tco_0698442 [Tanacetum coccineum]